MTIRRPDPMSHILIADERTASAQSAIFPVLLRHLSSDESHLMDGVEMTDPSSLTVRSARLRSRSGLFDIVIRNGSITGIVPSSQAGSDDVDVDAAGNLVTESFVNAHLHLDKVFTLQSLGDAALADYQGGDMGKAMSAIETAAAVKESQDPAAMLAAGRRALAMAAYYGNTHIRALADVDSKAGTRGVEILVALRDEFTGLVDVQVVAFAQDGIIREPGTEKLLRRSMEIGARAHRLFREPMVGSHDRRRWCG